MATSVNVKNKLLVIGLVAGLIATMFFAKRVWEIEQFNQAATSGAALQDTRYKFEAKYANAYSLAKIGRYQDATLLFNQLLETKASPSQVSAVQYNLGNIYLIRGLRVTHNGEAVKDEAQFLLNQARLAYQKSLQLDNQHLDARHNLDRVLSMLPDYPDGEGDKDKLGVVMGSIPTGLP